jgi:SAM-dependent methyltransferase
VPLLLADLRGWAAGNLHEILARDDLDQATESLLGDCAGPGSPYDAVRQKLSIYGWDHWGDLDPRERQKDLGGEEQVEGGAAAGAGGACEAAGDGSGGEGPGSALRLLERAVSFLRDLPPGPVLDLGCATGRTTCDLAALTGRVALGVDLSFAMLRLAAEALRHGRVRYPRRRVGVVYDRRDFTVAPPAAEHVDFWLADAGALPFFAAAGFAAVVALNALDCVADPHGLLATLARLLVPGGKAVLTTPYDWSPHATPIEQWLGGHSQRGPGRGAAEPVLRALLTPGAHPASIDGLAIVAEEPDLRWRVRLHNRGTMVYRVHLTAIERMG